MADPSRFDEMINWAFATATGIYVLLGVVGYIMFGNAVSDEVSSVVGLFEQYSETSLQFSLDLMKYNVHPALNNIALWGLVATPLSKYALTSRPARVFLEHSPESTSDRPFCSST